MSEILIELVDQRLKQNKAIVEAAQAVADQCHVVKQEIQKLKGQQAKIITLTIQHKSIYDLMPQET